MTATSIDRRPARARREWLAPAGLIALSIVPVLAGSLRLTQLTTSATVTAENARFFGSPVPVVVHIIGATTFLVLGALQFAPSLRRRRWHRITGRIVAPAGLATALSGMWMAVFYQLPATDGPALLVLRLGFGSAMAGAIVYAFLAIRRGDIRTHSAWMTRAYAIGLGAGTQVFTVLPWTLLGDPDDQAMRAVLMGAGWVVNLAVAEVVIRHRLRHPPAAPRVPGPSATAAAHLS